MAKKNWIKKVLALTVVFALAASLTVTGVTAAPGGSWFWPWPDGGDSDLYEWYEVYVQGQLADSGEGPAGDYYWLGTHYEADYEVNGSILYWEIVPQGVNNGKYSGSVDLTDYIGEIPEGYEVDDVVLESGSIGGVNDPVHDMYDNAVITITIKTLYNKVTGDEIVVDPPKPDPYTVSKQVKNAEGQWADSASFVLAEGETELSVEYRLVISGTAGTEYAVADDLAGQTFTGTIGENGEAVESYVLTLGVGESVNAIAYDGDHDEETGDETDEVTVIIEEPVIPEPPKPDPYTVSKQVKNAEGQWADSASFVLAEGETELNVEYRLVISGTAGTEYAVADDLAGQTFTGTIGENGETVESYVLTLGVGESINAIAYDGDHDEETGDETDEVTVIIEEPVIPDPPKPAPYTVSKQVKNAEGQWADSASFVLAEGETELNVEYRLVISGTAGTEYAVADDLAGQTFTGTIGENGEAVESYVLTLGVGESINAISYDDDHNPETPNKEVEIPVIIEEPEIIPEPPAPPAPPAKPDPYTVTKQVEDEYGNWSDSATFTLDEDETRMYVYYRLVISGTAGTEYAVYDDLAEKTFSGVIDEDGESVVDYTLRLKKGTHVNVASYDGDHDPETADEYDSASVRIKKRIIVVPADPKPEPEPVEPEPVEPEPVEPEPVEPEPVEPEPVEPEPVEPEPVEPEPVEPEPVEPEPVEPEPEIPEEPVIDEPVIEIPEEEVPLVELPEEPIIEIPEEEVPLADVPKTGSAVLGYAALTAISGLSLAWFGLKKKEN